jgi:hypothetical protein
MGTPDTKRNKYVISNGLAIVTHPPAIAQAIRKIPHHCAASPK